ncbi:MAG TPA: glycerol-3-phosphate 1-O-acyltransferase [Baekduia sp.]|nr:glycerol-3-phosphate 1-O-acyltransferase [Baekduia sp.]
MTGPPTIEAAIAPGRTGPSPVVVLADARTTTERRLVEQWAAHHHPGAEVLDLEDPGVAERIRGGGDTLLLPVRPCWLPPERRSGPNDRTRPSDLLLLADPRRPHARIQAMVVKRWPDRVRVVAGAPAQASELQERFRRHEGGGRDGLRRFVVRQAVLACDREERQLTGDRYKVPRLVAEQIAASARFRAQVEALADRLGRPAEDVLEEATACLDELATVQSPPAIDMWRAVVRPMHSRAWDVQPDWDGLERLRERNKENPLVFLPTHRSYVDPLVLAEVLHQADFPRNHVLGGDNMSFWPLGPLGKRAGVVFIRRSFGDDAVYRLAIKAYFAHLVAKRFNLEWYIEGGRTRTGKLRPPRFGLLHYLVEALQDEPGRDVLLVPTSIVYDRLQEVGAMAAEQMGAGKPREGLRWMADYIRAQRQRVGTAKIQFGEPFSLRDALVDAGDGPAQLEKVAFRICDDINRITPVTATSLVAFTLLGVRDRALTFREVACATAPLLDLLEERQVPGPLDRLRTDGGLRAGLQALEEARVVDRHDGGTEPVWSIARDAHHVAAFYRNGALHHLLLRAIVELVLLRLAGRSDWDDLVEAAWEDALALRDLLKFEFFFPEKQRFNDELLEEMDLLAPDWRQAIGRPGGAADLIAGSRVLVAARALRSFIDAQVIVARVLAAHDPRKAVDDDELMAQCLGLGEQLVRQGQVHGRESVSRELYGAALKLAANRDLVDPGREEVARGRRRWLEEVEEVAQRLARIGELDRAHLEEVLHDAVA